MTTVNLHTYIRGRFPAWSLRITRMPDQTNLVALPAGAVVDHERDGVEFGDKFYSAPRIYVLARHSLRGFSFL